MRINELRLYVNDNDIAWKKAVYLITKCEPDGNFYAVIVGTSAKINEDRKKISNIYTPLYKDSFVIGYGKKLALKMKNLI